MINLAPSTLTLPLSHIKLLALDVDGVLTDGSVCLLPTGEEIKFFNIHDGYGLCQMLKAGIEIAIITGRKSMALEARMQELGITRLYQACTDKLTTLQTLCQQLNITLAEVAYVGDDIPDREVMLACGIKLTVANAVGEIKQIADYCTQLPGGKGAVREICDLLLSAIQSQALEKSNVT